MDYAALYQKKLTSAAEAVKVVKSGDSARPRTPVSTSP